MIRPIRIKAPPAAIHGVIDLPSSKSISNRLLMIQSLCKEPFQIHDLSDSGDTRILSSLCSKITEDQLHESPCMLDCGMAGTVFRFLTARVCLEDGEWLLTGNQRMLERPVGDLVEPIRKLGANITYHGDEGYPPLLISGTQLKGGEVEVRADTSSQFISALLMIAPVLPGGLKLILNGRIVSRPYIDMTLSLLEAFGVPSYESKGTITVPECSYKPRDIIVEKDFSAASYWFEMVALNPGAKVLLKSLHLSGLQGDAAVVDIFRDLGVATSPEKDGLLLSHTGFVTPYISFDFTDFPDLFPAVASTCAGLGVPGLFTGIEHLEFKESRRITAIVEELAKTGISFHYQQKPYGQSSLSISAEHRDHSREILMNTHQDHRLAMAFAPLSLKWNAIRLDDPQVVSKSYPSFWDHLQACGFRTEMS